MPHERLPVNPDDDGWTWIKCEGCAGGTIAFDPDDEQRDGLICDGCDRALCDDCCRDQWGEKPHAVGMFCDACLAAEPPHDEATCDECARHRVTAAEAAADRARIRREAAAQADATVWPRMLACIRGVSGRRAAAIAAEFPSPRHLLDGYADARKRNISETALIADVRLPNGKRVGPVAAGAVRRAMLKD